MMHYQIRQFRRNSLRPFTWSLVAYCIDCGYRANVRCMSYREVLGAAHFHHYWGCRCIPTA